VAHQDAAAVHRRHVRAVNNRITLAAVSAEFNGLRAMKRGVRGSAFFRNKKSRPGGIFYVDEWGAKELSYNTCCSGILSVQKKSSCHLLYFLSPDLSLFPPLLLHGVP
jgi:hypothetical protein